MLVKTPYFGPTASIAAILAAEGKTQKDYVTSAEMKALKALQLEAEGFSAQLGECSHDAAKGERRKIQQQIATEPSPSLLDTLRDAIDGRISRQQYFDQRRKLVKEAWNQWSQTKLVPVVVPIIRRVEATCRAHAEAVAKGEQAVAERYGLPYEPSNVSKAIQAQADALGTQASTFSNLAPRQSPRSILAGIIDF